MCSVCVGSWFGGWCQHGWADAEIETNLAVLTHSRWQNYHPYRGNWVMVNADSIANAEFSILIIFFWHRLAKLFSYYHIIEYYEVQWNLWIVDTLGREIPMRETLKRVHYLKMSFIGGSTVLHSVWSGLFFGSLAPNFTVLLQGAETYSKGLYSSFVNYLWFALFP